MRSSLEAFGKGSEYTECPRAVDDGVVRTRPARAVGAIGSVAILLIGLIALAPEGLVGGQ